MRSNQSLPLEGSDHRIQIARTNVRRMRPPYPPDFMVTSISRFEENVWLIPKEQLPAGHKGRGQMNLLKKVRVIKGNYHGLTLGTDDLLIQQMKETLVAFIYNRDVLPLRKDIIKPLSQIDIYQLLLIFFANISAYGINSLDEIDVYDLQKIFERIENSPATHTLLIEIVRDAIILSANGLITRGFKKHEFQVEERKRAIDTSKERKIGPIQEHVVAELIDISSKYVDKRKDIARVLTLFQSREISNQQLSEWCYNNLPVVTFPDGENASVRLAWFTRIAAYNYEAFHLSMRASEILSAEKGYSSQHIEDGSRKIIHELTVFKGTSNGERRKFSVHPYLHLVSETLHLLHDALEIESKYLFTKQRGKEISVSELSNWLTQFAHAHGLTDEYITSHMWRYTLPDLLVASVKNSLSLIQYRLGHEYVSESIGYGFAGPARDEMRESAIRAAASASEFFMDRIVTSVNLGGKQGRMLTEALASGATIEDIKDDLAAIGTMPIQIKPGVFCLKQAEVSGLCSLGAGDNLPNSERCRADCQHQVQTQDGYQVALATIQNLPLTLTEPTASTLEKVRIAAEVSDLLIAWPSLNQNLEKILNQHPQLKAWFR